MKPIKFKVGDYIWAVDKCAASRNPLVRCGQVTGIGVAPYNSPNGPDLDNGGFTTGDHEYNITLSPDRGFTCLASEAFDNREDAERRCLELKAQYEREDNIQFANAAEKVGSPLSDEDYEQLTGQKPPAGYGKAARLLEQDRKKRELSGSCSNCKWWNPFTW